MAKGWSCVCVTWTRLTFILVFTPRARSIHTKSTIRKQDRSFSEKGMCVYTFSVKWLWKTVLHWCVTLRLFVWRHDVINCTNWKSSFCFNWLGVGKLKLDSWTKDSCDFVSLDERVQRRKGEKACWYFSTQGAHTPPRQKAIPILLSGVRFNDS